MVKSSCFVKSAASKADFIVSDLPQFAIVGKSNVGKSSLINYLVNDGRLARTSKDPGRTRLVNYFLINDNFFITDLPGYGYAKVSKQEKEKWGNLIEDYFNSEKMLAHVFFLVDIRHDPSREDMIMLNYLFKSQLPFTIIATKADKLSRSQLSTQISRIAACLRVGIGNIIVTSSINKVGSQLIEQRIEQVVANINNVDDEVNEE